jgi:large subunit ribosomal protein L4
MDGSEQGSVDLNDAVFGADASPAIVHQVVVALRNAKRQGNAETKTRKQVRGGGAKPFRQKGTGNARQGSTREPQMRGGGVVFGPHKRSYRQQVPATFRRKALSSALSDRVRDGRLCVLTELACETPKTKPFADMIGKISSDGARTLVVLPASNKNVLLSMRNIDRVSVTTAQDINALDVVGASRVVVVQDAIQTLEERLS